MMTVMMKFVSSYGHKLKAVVDRLWLKDHKDVELQGNEAVW